MSIAFVFLLTIAIGVSADKMRPNIFAFLSYVFNFGETGEPTSPSLVPAARLEGHKEAYGVTLAPRRSIRSITQRDAEG